MTWKFQYVTLKSIKCSVLSEYLAYLPVEYYQLMRFDFSDEDVMFIRDYEIPCPDEGLEPVTQWMLVFDCALNTLGNGIDLL